MNTNAPESFVPFTAARACPGGDLGSRGKPTARSGDRAGFIPGMPGGTAANAEATVSPSAGPTPPHAAAPSATVVAPRVHAEHAKPVVSLRREGDQVVGIRVECTCGSVIELDCVY
jgi:hypothetical protein